MESTKDLKNLNKIERKSALASWLISVLATANFQLIPLPGAASFRQYYRLRTPNASFIVMDAPPPLENVYAYTAIANSLRERGLSTPTIFHADLEQGFLIISDFGDLTYLSALDESNADQLYQRALSALAVMQSCREVAGWALPDFDDRWMWNEWQWHKTWFLHQLLGIGSMIDEKKLDHCFGLLIASSVAQPQVFMHRDYHAGNLMVLARDDAAGGVGILDFQDAFMGPLTYDAVSLLRDCYIDWPMEQLQKWLHAYWEQCRDHQFVPRHMVETEFTQWFDWMGLQRHIKALFTFARKQLRDHDAHYLAYVPRTLNYIVSVSARYPELSALHSYYQQIVSPAFVEMKRKLI